MMGKDEGSVRISLNGKLEAVTASKSEFTLIFKYPHKVDIKALSIHICNSV